MTGAIGAAWIAVLLAAGVASVGETLVGRAARSLLDWSGTFLVGAAACAAALFPLSWVAPRRALDAELILIALCFFVSGWRRLAHPGLPAPREGSDFAAVRKDRLALILLGAIVSTCLFFVALNHWYGHSWDSIQVWGTKAKRLYFEGGLSRRWFLEDAYGERELSYPSLIPFLEAVFGRLLGRFDLDAAKEIFPFFYVSMLLGTYAAARTVSTVRWALATVLLVALLPELTTLTAAGAYVDMPLAAFVAAVAAASLRGAGGDSRTLPWLIGSMTAVKQEGMILALVACGAILVSWIAERPRRLGNRLRSAVPGATVVLAFIAARVGYTQWIGVHDTTWGPFDAEHFSRALKSAGLIGRLCLHYMLEPRTWGLFWPAFFVAAAFTVASGLSRTAILALATASAIAVDSSLFLITNWDIKLHIEGSYARLLAQLAPAAAVVIGAAGQRLWSPRPSGSA